MQEKKLEKPEAFINQTKNPIRVKILDPKEKMGFRWTMVKVNEVIELPETHARAYGLKSVVEKPQPKATPKKKEKKPANLENPKKAYHKRLLKVKGIGEKTARDIEQAFQTEQHLEYAVNKGSRLPIRDDLEKEIVKAFKKNGKNVK